MKLFQFHSCINQPFNRLEDDEEFDFFSSGEQFNILIVVAPTNKQNGLLH